MIGVYYMYVVHQDIVRGEQLVYYVVVVVNRLYVYM